MTCGPNKPICRRLGSPKRSTWNDERDGPHLAGGVFEKGIKMSNDRDDTIRRIRTALQRRSGKSWSVTGGRGTSWGWITIDAPPSRRTWSSRLKPDASPAKLPSDYEEYDTGEPNRGCMSPAERKELGELLGLDGPAHHQGVSIAASSDHYREYIDRSEGREPYWDYWD